MSDEKKRLYIFRENHFGLGVRWHVNWNYQLDISIALPFVTIVLGFGKEMG